MKTKTPKKSEQMSGWCRYFERSCGGVEMGCPPDADDNTNCHHLDRRAFAAGRLAGIGECGDELLRISREKQFDDPQLAASAIFLKSALEKLEERK